jgi:hypothetical protein
VTASIRLIPRGQGIQPTLTVPVPASEVVITTLVVANDVKELPTLSSVEHIIGRLANLGLILASSGEGDRIAQMINKKFLPVPQEKWKDQDLQVHVERADSKGGPEALRAVAALRKPVLTAANTALAAGGAYGPVERRANEIRLVDEMSNALTHRKPVWLQYGTVAAIFIGKTVLDQIVKQLIGIPISDIVRSTLKGADRLVF